MNNSALHGSSFSIGIWAPFFIDFTTNIGPLDDPSLQVHGRSYLIVSLSL